IRATVMHDSLKLGAVVKPILESAQLPKNARITAMANCLKIIRVEFREKRISNSQIGVVNAQMFLQNLPSTANRLESGAGGGCATVIPPQIGPCLFAFENSCHSSVAMRSESRYIGTIPA